MAKSWTKTDINYLNRYAATKKLAELEQRFETTEKAVLAKLGELGLTTKDGYPQEGVADPAVEIYEEGLRHLYSGALEKAAAAFERTAAESDHEELSARARQMLAATHRRQHAAEADGDKKEDPFLLAVFARNRGDLDGALEICNQGGRRKKDERFAFLAASVLAAAGRDEEAVEALAQAVELNPENRVHAYHDPDFSQLRGDRDHAHLFGLD